MEKYGPLCWLLSVLLLSWIIAEHAAAQQATQLDNFLKDKENKVQLLGRHALFLQLAAESTDCGEYSRMILRIVSSILIAFSENVSNSYFTGKHSL